MTETPTVGDVVEDRDGTSPRGVVVNRPPIPAHDWHVQGRGWLADDNPDYPEDDRTAVVIFEDTLEEYYPGYTGYEGIPMAQINASSVPHYAFPESRLRPVDALEPVEVSLAELTPSPYHSRNFEAKSNRQYIDAIADRGRPKPIPIVRPRLDGGYEILNGHKRTWASYLAGLESIPVAVLPLDGIRAAKYWAQRHLPGYSPRERTVAIDRLRENLHESIVHQIEHEILSNEQQTQQQPAKTDGGRDE